jgi:hypothetical protein
LTRSDEDCDKPKNPYSLFVLVALQNCRGDSREIWPGDLLARGGGFRLSFCKIPLEEHKKQSEKLKSTRFIEGRMTNGSKAIGKKIKSLDTPRSVKVM